MQTSFTSDFFSNNRQRLRGLFTGTAPIVMTANGLLQRGADGSYGFAQDANFWYLTGIDESDIILVIDRDKEYLIVPARTESREAFDGAINSEELVRHSGIQTVYPADAGWELLTKRLKKVHHAATVAPPPVFVEQYGIYTNPARQLLATRLQEINPDMKLLDLGQHLAVMRMIKQPVELAAIQAAIDVTIGSIKDAFKPAKLSKYAYEYELEAQLTYGFRSRGASGHAFEPIVAGGGRACTLHNVANDHTLSADELVLVDVGAEVEHYAADITRTRSLRTPSRRQQAVHQAVVEVQQYAFDLLKPGINIPGYEQQLEHFMGEKLRELGLIKTITHEQVRRFCPHATSHFMGLNVHDVGDYSRPLEAGVVLTVEPGIYIEEENIGVRIEDDVLVTESGIEVLSDKLPRALC